MSLYLTAVFGVRRFMLRLAAVLGCVLALGAGVQGVMAAEGLRRSGKDLVADEMADLLAGFAVWTGYVAEPGPNNWLVMGANGRMEKSCHSPEELIAYFRTLPKERTARGIIITSDITNLKDPAAAQAQMSAHVKSLLANPAWVAARKKSMADLTAVCEREKIDLWVNVFPEGKGLRFCKLTR